RQPIHSASSDIRARWELGACIVSGDQTGITAHRSNRFELVHQGGVAGYKVWGWGYYVKFNVVKGQKQAMLGATTQKSGTAWVQRPRLRRSPFHSRMGMKNSACG